MIDEYLASAIKTGLNLPFLTTRFLNIIDWEQFLQETTAISLTLPLVLVVEREDGDSESPFGNAIGVLNQVVGRDIYLVMSEKDIFFEIFATPKNGASVTVTSATSLYIGQNLYYDGNTTTITNIAGNILTVSPVLVNCSQLRGSLKEVLKKKMVDFRDVLFDAVVCPIQMLTDVPISVGSNVELNMQFAGEGSQLWCARLRAKFVEFATY